MTTQEKTVAVFPGSFDPFTRGHEDIVKRVLPFFDKIIIAIGNNSEKNYLFAIEKRTALIKKTFANNDKIEVISYSDLTVNLCERNNAKVIIRGVRNTIDFENEQRFAIANMQLNRNLETFFVTTKPEYFYVSSTVLRDIYKNGGDIAIFLPTNITTLDL
jgi:pantetheine-phosphate adenylyltransferase